MKTRFIYLHIREDANEVFYVGKGTKNPKGRYHHTRYKRAFEYDNRNEDWRQIVEKTPFKVDIVEETVDGDEAASEMEKKWVAKYWDTGKLVNRTRGGCGIQGYVFSEEQRRENAARRLGKKGFLCPNSHEVFVYRADTGDFVGHFGSQAVASEALKVNRQMIGWAVNKSHHHAEGYLFYEAHQGDRATPLLNRPVFNGPKIVEQFDESMHKMDEFVSLTEASKRTGIGFNTIRRVCVGEQSMGGGFYWRYKGQTLEGVFACGGA